MASGHVARSTSTRDASNKFDIGFWCMRGRNLVAHAVARDARRLRHGGAPRARAAGGGFEKEKKVTRAVGTVLNRKVPCLPKCILNIHGTVVATSRY